MNTTANLGLNKYEPETDGQSNFNVDEALNKNWDKVDESWKDHEDRVIKIETTTGALSLTRSNKDVNDIYVTLTYSRADGTLFKTSILSGGASPEYTTRTVTYYAADGTTVSKIESYTLAYTDGELTSEVIA